MAAPPLPALLAFDTSTEWLHIGLAVGDAMWVHESEGGARASAALLPLLRAMLAEAGIGWQHLDAIAFGQGPGAFTGLRTASAAAQGLAFALHRPVLPVDTLHAVAVDALKRARTEDVWVAMDARMDEIYAGHYRSTDGRWRAVTAPALYKLDALNSLWQQWPPRSVAGTALEAFGPRLKTLSAQLVMNAQPGGHALIACARTQWSQGAHADPSAALPNYLRDRVALTADERAQAKRARFLA